MKREIKDLVVKALKSGEFKQGKGRLDDGHRYCVLGVIASLALCEGICTYDKGGKYDGRKESLSFNTMKWAGIAQFDEQYLEPGAGFVKFTLNGKETTLAALNDSGKSFVELAAIIEKNWEDL